MSEISPIVKKARSSAVSASVSSDEKPKVVQNKKLNGSIDIMKWLSPSSIKASTPVRESEPKVALISDFDGDTASDVIDEKVEVARKIGSETSTDDESKIQSVNPASGQSYEEFN